ncbi:hypothetical protein [Sphingomonas nostoxanthinifaciens]|uniref:hypothetical protein n=1 Tax=Sphingomonas nostoxanthinifaciens TaxID=2872652 RepID=UPI001CC1E3ED|nr:hypothetical protein [Sphingomonas nostoxanthinifaciens]UAK24094.1 hypothetical protein K8P63_17420 [Sphingomonas nostoxanthinifaciens]
MLFRKSMIALASVVAAAAPFAASAQYYGYGDRYAPLPAYYHDGYGYDRARYDHWRERDADRRYWRQEAREQARWDRHHYDERRDDYRPW